MQIGFTSTTFKLLSPEKIIELAKKAGAQCIEWSDKHVTNPEQAKDIAAQCAEAGIVCCSVGSYYRVGDNDDARWDNICQIAAVLDAKLIRVWLGKKGSAHTGEDEYSALLADAKSMTQAAGDYGVTIAAEAHPGTYNDTCDTSLRFLRELDEPAFCTYFQSWYLDMPTDMARLEQTYPYIRAAHVSFSEVRKSQRFRRKEKDCVERIVRALDEKNFRGPVLLEFCRKSSPKEFLKDMERLRSIVNAQN